MKENRIIIMIKSSTSNNQQYYLVVVVGLSLQTASAGERERGPRSDWSRLCRPQVSPFLYPKLPGSVLPPISLTSSIIISCSYTSLFRSPYVLI